ncbi:carboxypeptidase-like regulatory domain-containing protein [Haloferula sp. BvORR071]|uniref:carboxypeptidase-like regulatory domain-containing protein n=1 Tax=Haloferula sp. BvORR071 TaxID=1396141 RepID=UPI000556CEA7|nr:carboxypeptidase-like regulatory domain-containing protein [Haloferula sp. BvORR071]
MKKAIIAGILAIAFGLIAWGQLRGGRVTVIGPEGSPVQGAEVRISYVSGPAVLQGVTDAKGRVTIPAKRICSGGWHSIIASWQDAQGKRYMGANSGGAPEFPLTITISRW